MSNQKLVDMPMNEATQGYLKCVIPLSKYPVVQQMGCYAHHGDVTTLVHCLYVSYVSYRMALTLKMKHSDEIARGALLHDLFLYDWHNHKGEKLHAFDHPRIALQNAEKDFDLTEREREIIKKHMWPLTPQIPRYSATYVVSMADKYCSIMDTFGLNKHFMIVYNEFLSKSFAV
jgi:uncharacterized protein